MSLALAVVAALGAGQPGALPEYAVGDAFVFTDGHVEWLRAIAGGRLTWSGLGRARYQRSANPVVPMLDWQVGEFRGARRVIGRPDRLWPLARGASASFSVLTTVTLGAKRVRSAALWRCDVGREGSTTVPAGTFATWPIVCERYSPATMQIRERIRWDWSVEVGHYVRRAITDYDTGERSACELAAAVRSGAATEPRLRALARAAGSKEETRLIRP